MKRIWFLICLIILLCCCTGYGVTAEQTERYVFSNTTSVIQPEAFAGNSALIAVEIPEGVTEIGAYAFSRCTSLQKIYLPKSLQTIDYGAFDTECSDTLLIVHEGSRAHEWCVLNNHPYDFYVNPTPTPAPTEHPDANAVTYRALLVGNTYPGEDASLEGPDHDIVGMARMLARQKGTPYHVTSKLNATASGIRSAIATAFAGADGNDVSLFYFSGHGINSSSSDFLGALCGVRDTYVTVSNLREWLDTVPGSKIVLLDSCHSGNHINKSVGGDGFDPEKFNASVIAAFSAQTKGNLASGNYYVITSSSKNQTSISLGYGGYYVGLFTYGVAKGSGYEMFDLTECSWFADVNGNGDLTLGEVYDYVVSTVQSYRYSQSTQYYGSPNTVLWKK